MTFVLLSIYKLLGFQYSEMFGNIYCQFEIRILRRKPTILEVLFVTTFFARTDPKTYCIPACKCQMNFIFAVYFCYLHTLIFTHLLKTYLAPYKFKYILKIFLRPTFCSEQSTSIKELINSLLV